MENTGLETKDIEKIRAVFSRFPKIDQVLLYGSRSIGNYKPASDIDLTLLGDGIDLTLLQSIEFELDDLMLPYKFDISIFDKITNPAFIDHINRVGKMFYRKK